MEKVIKDGMVAVLYSPGYGAGWYSWEDVNECLFCPEIVNLIINHGEDKRLSSELISKIEGIAKSKWGDSFYCGGARDLTIKWLPVGCAFEVQEYDGYESIETIDDKEFIVA